MLNRLLNIGIEGASATDARTIRIVNLLGLITVSSVSVYFVFYLITNAFTVAAFSVFAALLYSVTFALTYFKRHRAAIIWVLLVYMTHLFILTVFIFTKKTGFHFYYLAIPAVIFLVFEYHNNFAKIIASAAATGLFFVCEIFEVEEAYFLFSDEIYRLLYFSVIFELAIGISAIVFLFNRSFKLNEEKLENLIKKLQTASSEVKTLKGFLPICASCKKIRDDKGYWNQIESYIQEHSEAEFSHGVCPDCAKELYPKQNQKRKIWDKTILSWLRKNGCTDLTTIVNMLELSEDRTLNYLKNLVLEKKVKRVEKDGFIYYELA